MGERPTSSRVPLDNARLARVARSIASRHNANVWNCVRTILGTPRAPASSQCCRVWLFFAPGLGLGGTKVFVQNVFSGNKNCVLDFFGEGVSTTVKLFLTFQKVKTQKKQQPKQQAARNRSTTKAAETRAQKGGVPKDSLRSLWRLLVEFRWCFRCFFFFFEIPVNFVIIGS